VLGLLHIVDVVDDDVSEVHAVSSLMLEVFRLVSYCVYTTFTFEKKKGGEWGRDKRGNRFPFQTNTEIEEN
jgi:hypothetical protein